MCRNNIRPNIMFSKLWHMGTIILFKMLFSFCGFQVWLLFRSTVQLHVLKMHIQQSMLQYNVMSNAHHSRILHDNIDRIQIYQGYVFDMLHWFVELHNQYEVWLHYLCCLQHRCIWIEPFSVKIIIFIPFYIRFLY